MKYFEIPFKYFFHLNNTFNNLFKKYSQYSIMAVCITTLIPIFITLLLCGFLFVFFNARLADVKNAVEKQNRVLTAFITNVQSDIRGASAGGNFQAGGSAAPSIGVNHLVSEEALNAVNAVNTVNTVKHNENEKIVVSEDESDSEDDSDDSESSDDSEDEDDDSEGDEDDSGSAADLDADARAEVVHLDGCVCLLWWCV